MTPIAALRMWLTAKWYRGLDPSLLEAYRATFSSPHGERVLFHLFDTVYCTVYAGTDPLAAALHAGRRSIVQEILENLDMAEHPGKYSVQVTTGENHG